MLTAVLTDPCHRRQHGQGTNGSFEVFVYAGRDPLTGKERRLTGTALTRKEAERLRTRLLGRLTRGEVAAVGVGRPWPS